MQSIGHPDARFDPLTLDFFDEDGSPASSVLWLENMGGKTSWLSLVFSVLQPGLKDFLGRPRKRLGEYVAPKDTAHVILEFSQITGVRTLKGTGARLVVGQVLQWKGRRQDLGRESSQLDRRFWGVVVDPATNEEARLFERVRELTFTEEGHRAPLDAFVEALGDEVSGDIFRPDSNQSKWIEWLTKHGLDPTVFKHQIKMSEDEGSISESFQFQTGDELVQWALPYIVPSSVPDRIAETVDEVRGTLQRKPRLEEEQRFCREIEELLTHTATQQEQLLGFRREGSELWDESLRVVDQMREAANRRRRDRDGHTEKAKGFKETSDQAQAIRNRKQGQSRAVEYLLARLRYEECDRTHGQAKEAAERCEALVQAWRLTETLRKKSSAEHRLEKVDAQLQEVHDLAAPKRAALATAAVQLSIKLEELLSAGRSAQLEAERGIHDGEVLKQETRTQLEAVRKRLADVGERKAATHARLEVLDRELEKSRKEGMLGTGQSIEEALEVAHNELERAEAEAKRLKRIEDEAKEALAAVREEAKGAEQVEHEARRAKQEARIRLERMDSDARKLLEDETVVGSFQTGDPDIWTDGPAAMGSLGDQAERAAIELVTLAVDSAEDTRALDRLERDGTLPPRVDVERVLAALSEAGVRSAFSGWEVLRTRVPADRRRTVIETHPELVEGILLTDSRELAVAEEVARQVILSQTMTLATADTLDIEAGSARVVVLTGPEAHYNESAAEQDRQQRRQRLDKVEERRAALKEHQSRIDVGRASIRHFLTIYPASTARELREAAAEKAEALLEAEDRVKQLAAGHQEAETAVRKAETQRLGAEGALEKRRQRLSRLQDLAASQKPRGELEEGLAKAVAQIRRYKHAISEGEAAEQLAVDQIGENSQAKLKAEYRIREWEGLLEKYELAAASSGEEVAESLDVLERSYLDAKADLMRDAAPDELTTERRRLAAEIAGFQREIQSHEDSVVEESSELLASPEGTDSASRREAAERADGRSKDAVKKLGVAEADLEKSKLELSRAEEVDSSRRTALDSEPKSIEEAEALRTQLSEEASEALRKMEEAKERQQHHQKEAERTEAAATEFDNAASDLAVALSRYANEIGRDSELPDRRRVAVAWSGEPQNARNERRTRENMLVEVGEYIRLAAKERKEALEKVRHRAEENRELMSAEMPALLPRLTQGSEDQRGNNARELARGLADRAVSIEKQLSEIEAHRRILVDQLASQSRETVRLLERLQRRSTLPDGLAEWSGRPYLTLSHPPLPETSEELKGRVTGIVDQICNEPSTTPTDGMTLLYKAVSKGVGGPFTARILKPNKALNQDRVDISEMATFSGGQKVTSALIMFAALTRMRAESHSSQPQTKAVVPLLLDNPIGKANQATLIEVQQRVADAYGLQLIYTTGIHDIGALAAFRVIVRIEGLQDTKTGRVHLQVNEEASSRIKLDSIRLIQHGQSLREQNGGTA